MFKLKLQALDYHNSNDFNANDSQQTRQLIAWIEDQKIRHYKIEDRAALRDVDSKDWDVVCRKYLSDIGCPFGDNQWPLVLDWILTIAIRFEYEDNLEKYEALSEDNLKREPQMVRTNLIDNLDFESHEFKEGVKRLAQMLKVPTHPTNHLMTLRAISLLIRNEVSMESKDTDRRQKTDNRPKDRKGLTKLMDNSMELRVGSDSVLKTAAKLLRLLYVNDLRELQTNINEMIASVQSVTANPKTDTTLGKVGV